MGDVSEGMIRRLSMNTQYDLFEVVPNQFPRWIGGAVNLAHAKERLKDLAQSSSGGEYFVRDFYSGSVVAHAHKLSPRRSANAQAV
jgi:hypothetical protein